MGLAILGPHYQHVNTPNSTAPDCMSGCGNTSVELNCVPCCNECNGHIAARSLHPGGVNALSCDGSVAFYSDSIDLALWQSKATIQGGEVISR